MSDLSGLVSIESIVKETLWFAKRGDAESNYKRFFQYAINGYRELNKHHFKNTKRVKLTMDSNNIIPFPYDMVYCVNIYIHLNGEYIRMSKRNTMVDTTSLKAGVTFRDTEQGENEDMISNVLGFQAGTLNEYGYFTEDIRNSRFIFNTTYTTDVIIDYITNGISSGSDLVPTMVKDALQSYIMWQESRWSREYNLGEKQLHQETYKDSVRMLLSMQAPSLEEMADDLNRIGTQLPTRN
jgi:hypothetical protein